MINAITTTIGNRYNTAYWPVVIGAHRTRIPNNNQNWESQHVRAAQALLDDAALDFNDGRYIIAGSALLGTGSGKAVHIVEWQDS